MGRECANMQWQLSPSVMVEAGTALGILIIAVYFSWRDISRRASIIGSTLMIIGALWILTHSLEIGTPVSSYKAYLMGLQLIWGLGAMTLWLMYIIYYIAPGKWQTGRIYTLFGIMPLLAILAVTTNHIHGLIWTAPGLDIYNPYLPLQPAYGPLYWVCMTYIGAMTVCGSFLIFKVVRQHNFRRWEPWILILAAVIPLLAAFLEVTGFIQATGLTIGITPFFSGIGIIALVGSLPRFHLKQIIPVAQHFVFERISDGVVVLNMQNRIVDLNPAAEHLAGYTSSEALGLPVEQIWPSWPSQLVLSEPASAVYEELVLTRAGEKRTYSLHIYVITDHENRPMNKLALLSDATERKQAEVELQKYRDHLEQIVEEKTAELKAKDRLAAIGETTTMIGHDLRNPLQNIINILYIAEKKIRRASQEQRSLVVETGIIQDISDIKSRINYMNKIVSDLQDYARPVIAEKFSTNIVSLVKECLSDAEVPENIAVNVSAEEENSIVELDPILIKRAFINLITNAVQAMPGGGTLDIRMKDVGGEFAIEFSDTGLGIPAEVRDKLFKPLLTTKAKGMGMGLPVVKRFIEAHDGSITLTSPPDEGTTFVVKLPWRKKMSATSPSTPDTVSDHMGRAD